jgi:hypothetical protein
VLSELFGCSIESLQYTLWYLRGKRYVETINDSDLVITVDGVDYLEAEDAGTERMRSGEQFTTPLPLPSPRGMTPESLTQAARRNGSNH